MLALAAVVAGMAGTGSTLAVLGMFPGAISSALFVGVFTGIWTFVGFALLKVALDYLPQIERR